MIAGVENRHFDIERGDRHAHVWATRMLPFEPMGWQVSLRIAMAAELDRLARQIGPLTVDVWDRDRRVHDLENAVMYNVGPSRFDQFIASGIHLRRLASPMFRTAPPLVEPAAAQYRFAVGAGTSFPSDVPSQESFTFTFALPRLESVLAVWRLVRPAVERIESPVQLAGARLGLAATIPAWVRASHLKPLLDGVVAALHSCEDEAALGCMRAWNVSDDELHQLRVWPGPLGPRPVVRPTRHGAAWNPADDQLDEIVVRRATEADEMTVLVWAR